jgi:hypothetical protein
MKKSKLALTALLALLCLSAAGCLFSFVYASWQDLARQNRQNAFRELERREKEAYVLAKEFREWERLPLDLKKFHDDNILSMEQFAAFRRDLDARLAANGLRPPRIDFSFGNKRGNIRKVTVKFSLESGYRDLKKFIFDMEAKAKMHFFTAMQLNAGANTVKGAFTMEVYLGE